MIGLGFNNYSRFSREIHGRDTYAWCVYVEADAELINKIEMVEYTLHPTFRNPVQEITDKQHCFALQSEGWGTFEIEIRVFFEDGSEQDEVYMLKLETDDWPKGPMLDTSLDDDAKRLYSVLLDGRLDWRKISTVARNSFLSMTRANEILRELASNGYVRKAYFRSIEDEELWGATFRVGKLPMIGQR
jgi:hypothetical protein